MCSQAIRGVSRPEKPVPKATYNFLVDIILDPGATFKHDQIICIASTTDVTSVAAGRFLAQTRH